MEFYTSQISVKFSYLPLELVNMILQYLNVISYRTGKYIDKIQKNDIRYDLLKKITRPIKISNNQYYIGLREYNKKVIKISLNYILHDNNILIIIDEHDIFK